MPQIPEVAIAVTVCVISSYAVTFFIIDVFVVNEATKWIYTSYGALLAGKSSLTSVKHQQFSSRVNATL